MSSLSRPLRSALLSPALRGSRRLQQPPHRLVLPLLHARFAANSVSGKPGSQTIEHARQNVKEEVGNSLTDSARSIAGGVFNVASFNPNKDSFVSIPLRNFPAHCSLAFASLESPRRSPQQYQPHTSSWVSLAACPISHLQGLPSTSPARPAWLPRARSQTSTQVWHSRSWIRPSTSKPLMALSYSPSLVRRFTVLVRSFSVHSVEGALHWGMEFAGLGGFKGYPRLLLGVSPAIVAWSTITLQPTSALICQFIGFTALWYADNKATTAGWSVFFLRLNI